MTDIMIKSLQKLIILCIIKLRIQDYSNQDNKIWMFKETYFIRVGYTVLSLFSLCRLCNRRLQFCGCCSDISTSGKLPSRDSHNYLPTRAVYYNIILQLNLPRSGVG